MAKYIKFNLTDGEDLSIEINDIESVSYIDANTTQIDLNNGISKFTITHGSALQATAVVEAVYAAMMAPTIGVYSVVKGPISVAQAVDSSSGRQLITTKEKNVTFTSYVFETVPAMEPFELKWETTTPNEEIQIGVGSGTFDYAIDWGDGTVETYNTDANISHTYATAGDHITKITGDFPHMNMGDAGISATFKNKLYEILNWGGIAWESLETAFDSCINLDFYNSIDSPNLQNCTSLFKTFRLCTALGNLNGGSVDLSNWNVSNVTSIGEFIISYNNNLNVNLSGWVINANITFGRLVSRCLELNVTNWNVSNVTNFSNMLNESNNLQEIVGLDTWNVSNGVNFTRMFRRVYDLTSLGDLTSWQFAPNANLDAMFFANVVDDNLDQTSRDSILNLDVSNAVDMRNMFAYTNTSWLNLSNWDVSGVSNFLSFLHNSTLTTPNYDATLISWAAQSLQSNVNITFGNSQYTLGGAAEAARNTLINTYSWTITDGGGI